MGRRSGQARRERKAQRERDAELDKLTLRARLATVGASELTVDTLREVFQKLLDRAINGSGHVANGAAKLVLDLAAASFEEEGGDEIEGVAFEDMTSAQRAVYRARLEKLLERSEEEIEELLRSVNDPQDNGRAS